MWVLLAATLVWTVGTWSVTVIGVATTRAHAGVAADLAALAAAAHARDGEQLACATAREVAEANHARLASCTTDDATRVADVTVAVDGRGPLARGQPAYGRARAGPGGAVS